jgi:hypothetical protein
MPIKVSWIAPGHIIRLTLIKNVTLDHLAVVRDELTLALAETAFRLDYVIDLRGLEHVTDKVLQFMLEKRASLRNVKTGCIAVIGGTEAQRLILASAALALHLTIGYFDDEYEALQFIAESTA